MTTEADRERRQIEWAAMKARLAQGPIEVDLAPPVFTREPSSDIEIALSYAFSAKPVMLDMIDWREARLEYGDRFSIPADVWKGSQIPSLWSRFVAGLRWWFGR